MTTIREEPIEATIERQRNLLVYLKEALQEKVEQIEITSRILGTLEEKQRQAEASR